MTPSQQNQLESLLRALSSKTPEERTRVLDDLSRQDPELAAHLSLRINLNATAAQTVPMELAALALEAESGLPPRFEVRRKLGEGGFGAVYDALDRERGERVAVKVLRKLDAEALYRFKQEFRVLADLKHRNLIRLHDLTEHRQVWFFTMELVEGTTFLRYVRTPSGCDENRLRHALDQLTHVLIWLHSHSILHRDVKPENIILTESDRLVLLDFGLARHARADGATRPVLAGTPAYMAPEQISDESVTEAADWYAVGTILYQALANRLPFEGSPMRTLRAKCAEDAPPLPGGCGIGSEWNQLCRGLLARDPGGRATGGDILLHLGHAAESRDRVLRTSKVVGREEVLHRMMNACAAARAGAACEVLDLRGPSGFGKSAILQAFSESVRAAYPDAVLLRGRCYEHESMPFKAVDALIDNLSRCLRSPALNVELPADIALLARLFPVLQQAPEVAALIPSAPALPANPAEVRRRAFVAFADLIDRLCEARLVVICVDDLQWGDRDSAALWQTLLSRPRVPPMVIATTCRSESVEADFVLLWREMLTACGSGVRWSNIEVDALKPAACRELARIMCSRLGLAPEMAEDLAEESRGNPFLLEQLATSAAHSGVEAALPSGASVKALVTDRINRLSAPARQFLEMLAAAGEPLPEEVLAKIAPGVLERSSAMHDLISQRLVRTRQSSRSREIEIYHDEIRGALIGTMPEPERRAIYVRIAQALEAIGYDDPGMIAIQYAQGGEPAKAAPHAIRAAEAAEAVLAFDRAARFYGTALAMGDYDRESKSQLYRKLAEALAAGRRYRDAAVAFLQAAQTAGSPEENTELRRFAAEHWIQTGELREGLAILNSLGREFRVHHIENRVIAIASIAWYRTMLLLRGTGYKERPAMALPPRELARLDFFWSLTAGLALRNPLLAQRFQAQYERLALRTGEPRRVALALALEGGALALAGERKYYASRAVIEQALALARRLNDPHAIGFATAMDGISNWLTGRWERAYEAGDEAERILTENCAGAVWELSIARNALTGGLIWGGHWRSAASRLVELKRDAYERGDLAALAGHRMNSCMCSLAADDPDGASRDLDEAEAMLDTVTSAVDLHTANFFGAFGRVQVAMYRNRPLEALEVFDRNGKQIRRSLLLRVETLNILAALMEANATVSAAAERIVGGQQAEELIERARRCRDSIRARRAIWSAGIAFTIDGGIEAALGNKEAAAATWKDAHQECDRVGMKLYAAAARYWRGRITGDAASTRIAEDCFRAENILRPERIAAILVPGMHQPALH